MVSPVDPVSLAMERNWEMIDEALVDLDEAAMIRQPTDRVTLWPGYCGI